MSETTGDKKLSSLFFFPVCHLQIHLGKKILSTKNAPEVFSCGLKTWIFEKHRFRDYFFGSGEAGQKAECTEEDV